MNPVLEYILFLLNLTDCKSYGHVVPSRGFYFRPSLHCLLVYYLAKTILGLEPPADFIKHIDDLYKLEPHQLPIAEFTIGKSGEAYFFATREPNEAEMIVTNNGYWRVVEEDEDKDRDEEEDDGEEDDEAEEIKYENYLIGFKKTYVFYQGNAASGVKTCWVLREYRFNSGLLPPNLLTDDLKTKMDTMVVCKIKDTKKREKMRADSDC